MPRGGRRGAGKNFPLKPFGSTRFVVMAKKSLRFGVLQLIHLYLFCCFVLFLISVLRKAAAAVAKGSAETRGRHCWLPAGA